MSKFIEMFPDLDTYKKEVIDQIAADYTTGIPAWIDETKMIIGFNAIYRAFKGEYIYHDQNRVDLEQFMSAFITAHIQLLPALYARTQSIRNDIMSKIASDELIQDIANAFNEDPDTNFVEVVNAVSQDANNKGSNFDETSTPEGITKTKSIDRTKSVQKVMNLVEKLNQIASTQINGELLDFVQSEEFSTLFTFDATADYTVNVTDSQFKSGELLKDISIIPYRNDDVVTEIPSIQVIESLENWIQSVDIRTLNNETEIVSLKIDVEEIITALSETQWVAATPIDLVFVNDLGTATFDPADLPTFDDGDSVMIKFLDTNNNIAEYHIESWNDGSKTDIDFFGDNSATLQAFADRVEVDEVASASVKFNKQLISISRIGVGGSDASKANVDLSNVTTDDVREKSGHKVVTPSNSMELYDAVTEGMLIKIDKARMYQIGGGIIEVPMYARVTTKTSTLLEIAGEYDYAPQYGFAEFRYGVGTPTQQQILFNEVRRGKDWEPTDGELKFTSGTGEISDSVVTRRLGNATGKVMELRLAGAEEHLFLGDEFGESIGIQIDNLIPKITGADLQGNLEMTLRAVYEKVNETFNDKWVEIDSNYVFTESDLGKRVRFTDDSGTAYSNWTGIVERYNRSSTPNEFEVVGSSHGFGPYRGLVYRTGDGNNYRIFSTTAQIATRLWNKMEIEK